MSILVENVRSWIIISKLLWIEINLHIWKIEKAWIRNVTISMWTILHGKEKSPKTECSRYAFHPVYVNTDLMTPGKINRRTAWRFSSITHSQSVKSVLSKHSIGGKMHCFVSVSVMVNKTAATVFLISASYLLNSNSTKWSKMNWLERSVYTVYISFIHYIGPFSSNYYQQRKRIRQREDRNLLIAA